MCACIREMTDEQEHELLAANEQLAQARDTIEEMRHKEAQVRAQMADVEARELALKGKFDQCVELEREAETGQRQRQREMESRRPIIMCVRACTQIRKSVSGQAEIFSGAVRLCVHYA